MKNILIILVLALAGVAVWYFVIHNKNTAKTGTTAGNTVDSPPNGGDAGNLSTSDNTPVSTVYQNASNNGVQVITDLPTAGLGAGSSQYFPVRLPMRPVQPRNTVLDRLCLIPVPINHS